MKMLKKSMALLVAVLMLLTSMTFTSFAATIDTERSTIVMDSKTVDWNGVNYGTDTYKITNDAYGLGSDTALKRGYNTSYHLGGGSSARRANIHRGAWATDASAAGWYQVYVDRLVHGGSTPTPFHTVSVLHRDGTSNFIIDRNVADGQTGWKQTRHYVGTFYFDNTTSHQVRIYFPVDFAQDTSKNFRSDVGAVIFVPVTSADDGSDANIAEGEMFYKPVYTADIGAEYEKYTMTEGSEYELYDGESQLILDASEGATSVTIPYDAANADLADALDFNEGIIQFSMAWKYTNERGVLSYADAVADTTSYVAPYFSVTLGKAADKTAEIKIYGNKVELIENGGTPVALLSPTDYTYYYNASTNENEIKSALTGLTPWKYNTRIEIVDVTRDAKGIEATSRALSKDGAAGKNKLLKVYLNGSSGTEVLVAAGYLPSTSIFYETDTDVTDNYIKFTNSPGSTTTDSEELMKLKRISVMKPDDDNEITSNEMVVVNESEFSEDNLAYSKEMYIPIKYTKTYNQNKNQIKYAGAIASYDSTGKVMKDVAPYVTEVLTGTKKKIDVSLNAESGDIVKFFQWDTFESLTPIDGMYKEVTVD